MIPRKALLFSCVMLAAAALAAPTSASAFKLVKAAGGAITKHTEIHYVVDSEFDWLGTKIKCEINGTLTTQDGTKATTRVVNTKLITNSCTFTGFYAGCKVAGDVAGAPEGEEVTIDENALTFNFLVLMGKVEGAECKVTYIDMVFEPLKVVVGMGAITVGIVEGKGEIEDDFGPGNVVASGEMTLGQYTEAGVNKGSAKGVFKIE